MSKKQVAVNFSSVPLDLLKAMSSHLNISMSVILESLLLTNLNKTISINEEQITDLNTDFLMNRKSSITAGYRDMHNILPIKARLSAIIFHYQLNLIDNIYINTQKQANIFKSDRLVCYFARGIIGRRRLTVFDYVRSLGYEPYCIGPINKEKLEYFFIGNKQQFTIDKDYTCFNPLLNALNVPIYTNVIQFHYSVLPQLSDALRLI